MQPRACPRLHSSSNFAHDHLPAVWLCRDNVKTNFQNSRPFPTRVSPRTPWHSTQQVMPRHLPCSVCRSWAFRTSIRIGCFFWASQRAPSTSARAHLPWCEVRHSLQDACASAAAAPLTSCPQVPPEAAALSMRSALLAPFFGAGTLGALYYCITVLHIDPSLAYRLLTTVFAAFAGSLVLRDALLAIKPDLEPSKAEPAAGLGAALLAAAYLAGGGAEELGGVAVNNFLGFSLCLLSVRSVPLRSFAVGKQADLN